MKVLLVGSGGREHALAWKLAQSPRLEQLWIAPGNPGTAALGANLSIPAEDAAGLAAFARRQGVDLVVIGPEAPLAAGLADVLRAAGVRVFGPGRTAAEIESSKSFSKHFMARHGIPSARFAVFSDLDAALRHLNEIDYPVVIKASGLAAGKGVVLPATPADAQTCLRRMLVEGEFGAAGREVVIEERLSGPEVSLLAFTDGSIVKAMLPAQDHKRLLDGDAGPNTGGMGAYAPAPVCPPALVEEIVRTVLQPAVDGLRAEGRLFVGVLYAGMMLTKVGPRVLEFNCRFGDPETQALLPLLKSDLLDILISCADGTLDRVDVAWRAGSAACVVLAAEGYPIAPRTGDSIKGVVDLLPETVCFQAGTKLVEGQLVTGGGRVLAVSGWADTLPLALERAYASVARIRFKGMHFRKDIGRQALAYELDTPTNGSAYARAGVSIDAGSRAVNMMGDAVRSTYTGEVLSGIGSFGGLFSAEVIKRMSAPVLVASTDGVGTKVKLAAQVGSYASIGEDIVNHCINDILVQGARPLFFLDYFATSKLDPQVVAQIVTGMASACRASGCALLGGETAEMPGVYAEGEFDVAGTIVGVVERERILPRQDLRAGDVLIGLRSSGPHTNGYSLIRSVFEGVPLDTVFPGLGAPLQEVLLAPHRSYLPLVLPVLETRPGMIKALVHLTGGGFIENIPRVLPAGLDARIQAGSWPVPPLYDLIQTRGNIAVDEMRRVFNLGIGMLAVVAPEDVKPVQRILGEQTWVIGELVSGTHKVVFA
jgi:phosphoribosylamine--glycine ligase / phosphoribosylformylglycinamidine cyclo-ligase